MSVLSRPYFHDEAKAFEWLESIIWAQGASCPHCGAEDRLTRVTANPAKRIRIGLWRCGHCRGQFTVKVGTVFEHARIPLHKMLQAVHLIASSKKGISANQIHRLLGITYKSAWFLSHRIREAMRSGDFAPFGSDGGVVEADETFIGFEPNVLSGEFDAGKRGFHGKMKVLALVDRNTGRSKAYVVDKVAVDFIMPILRENIAREARLATDDAGVYRRAIKHFAAHGVVRHSRGQYGLGDVHTNTVEGYFSIFKRGMRGVYQFCGKKHLHRYLAEFDFRYSNREATGCDDSARADLLLAGIVGRRLTYRATCSA